MLKKILRIIGIVLLVLIVLAFAAPIMFKGKLMKVAKANINKNLNAKVDFKDLNISLFRHFPMLAVGLEDLQVTGVDEFASDTLISASRIDLALNLWSVISGGEIKISSISVDKPRIHAIVNKEGKANWDITIPDTTAVAAESKPFKINLKHYEINQGYLSYIDIPGDMSSEIFNLNHSGSGDLSSDIFMLKTSSEADAVNFVYSKIPYLVNAKAMVGADIQVDNKTSTYTFKTDDISVNDLKLSSSGFFRFVNDSVYGMDIQFKAPSTEFKTVLSLVPAVYNKEFDKIKTSGKALFSGFVKGNYSSTQIPAYQVNLEVSDGFFQYPDLPQPVKNINLAMKVDNPDGVTDHTIVDISKGHIEFGTDPFDFRLLLKNPITDQFIDAAAKGKLDLSRITQFVKLDPSTKLSGLIDADIFAKGNVAVITRKQKGDFSARGYIDVSNLNYSSKDFPQPIHNTSMKIVVDNPDGVTDHTVVRISSGHVELGNNPIDFNLLAKTPASDLYFEGNAKGKFNLANLAQFSEPTPGTSYSGLVDADISFRGNKSAIDKKEYQKVQTSGTMRATDVKYVSKDYPGPLTIPIAEMVFNPAKITLSNLKAEYLGTHYSANGSLDNAIGYALYNEPLAGTLNLSADKIDLNALMGTNAAKGADSTAMTAFAVPKNINLLLNAAVDKLTYDKVDYNNLNGAILVKDETVTLKNVQTNALDGSLALSGTYSTKMDKKKPDISLSYDVSGLDAQKTFYAFNTVQKLMPIGKFIGGKISSQLNMKGKLGEDMMPNLSSLTGNGSLLLLEGFLRKFAPLEKLGQTLNVDQFSDITLKDIKNYFEFANGKVLVKPFKVKVKDIEMEIGGMHGLDQSIDYLLDVKLPRSLMGSKGNALVDNLAQQAGSKGVPVKLGDIVDLKVKMGGTITNPTISTDLKGAATDLASDLKQQAADFAKQKVDSAKLVAENMKNELKDSAKSIKDQALKGLQEDITKKISGSKDSSGAPANTVDNSRKAAEQTLKNTFNNLLKKKKPSKDSTGK